MSVSDFQHLNIQKANRRSIELCSKVAGVTFGNRQQYIKSLSAGDPLCLRRERQNQYDPNAIAVYDSMEHHLGYVPKDLASKLAPLMDSGEQLQVNVSSVTGGNGYNYGLNIKIVGNVSDSL